MKPIQEQEWKVRNTNHGPIIDSDTHPEGDAVCMVYAPMSVEGRRMTLAQSDAILAKRARAISALPDALRALLEHGRFGVEPNGDTDVWHNFECWATNRAMCTPSCQRDRSALHKAGVLP